MKKRVVSILLVAAMAVSMVACGSKKDDSTDNKTEETKKVTVDDVTKDSDTPETTDVVRAQGLSGNVLVTIAQEKGYFKEVGLNIKEVPLDSGQLQGVVDGQVDIASNSGTNGPLQMIAAGDDMAIIGGFIYL